MADVPTLVAVIVGVPAVLAAYIVGGEYVVRLLPDKLRPSVRPWIWVGPALAFVGFFLVYPVFGTAYRSLFDLSGNSFVGLSNYVTQLSGFPSGGSWIAIRNNVFWLVFFTVLVLAFGLLFAVLTDRVSYESPIKSLIFMPMAISFVAIALIWKFMYSYQPPGEPQTGTVNALLGIFHQDPRLWVQDPNVANQALIVAAVWGFVGFAMVILSAALKGIPGDLLEAARVDGAGELTIFRRVIFPLMMPTIVVVGTTLVIFALKAFDVVYVMTNGNYDTDVLANRMYKLLTASQDFGDASAVAIILVAAVIPVLIFNLRQFRAVEARR
ncbi:MAG: sugar ABC transporter permease [Chloroflexi bacterium]|nr:MAG: sugar ABC transporter permease [Chloroflexota bacterium]TMC73840.1 MAG: sugar ABC transporter permease [Chloroflexota bacterium]